MASYATQEDVEARLRRDLTAAEETGIVALLEDATDAVIGYCGQGFTTVPQAVKGVVAKAAARALARGSAGLEFLTGQTAGPFGQQYSQAASSGDVWLTAADKLALRPHRLGGGMSSVLLVGEQYEIEDDES